MTNGCETRSGSDKSNFARTARNSGPQRADNTSGLRVHARAISAGSAQMTPKHRIVTADRGLPDAIAANWKTLGIGNASSSTLISNYPAIPEDLVAPARTADRTSAIVRRLNSQDGGTAQGHSWRKRDLARISPRDDIAKARAVQASARALQGKGI